VLCRRVDDRPPVISGQTLLLVARVYRQAVESRLQFWPKSVAAESSN
jgi:hypothetical protein